MSGFLLLSPTGSGKSWVCNNDPFYIHFASDGDHLIKWPPDWRKIDWVVKDLEHLNIVLDHMQSTGKCVCWYVGTTAVADALKDGRLCREQVVIVLPPEAEHRNRVEQRGKQGHDWAKASEHRAKCEGLVQSCGLPCFPSFEEATKYLKEKLR